MQSNIRRQLNKKFVKEGFPVENKLGLLAWTKRALSGGEEIAIDAINCAFITSFSQLQFYFYF